MEKYVFREYNKKFPELFKREKYKLKKILPKAKIEHIGSTSVKSLGGKGIIDIIVGVSKNKISSTKNKLIKNKYNFKPKAGDKDRLFFERDYKYKNIRRVHLQLTYLNSKTWKNAIKIRNKLKENKEISKQYEKTKKQAIKIAEGDGRKYRKNKGKFLKSLLK